jgi:hypothetical protein
MDYSLTDILRIIKKQNDTFDEKKFFIDCKKKYPEIKKNYQFIPPYNIDTVETGDLIRYLKNNTMSCLSIVIRINYAGTNIGKSNEQKYIESMDLENIQNRGTYWKIYPENYFIFKCIPNKNTAIKSAILDYAENLPDFKALEAIDPSISNKIIKKINTLNDADNYATKLINDMEKKQKKNKKN